MNDNFSILIATQNGSGSQSCNQILAKAMFRSGRTVGAKNIFPSNIAGLPTWFTLRLNTNGYTSMEREYDLVVAKNADTIKEDLYKVRENGYLLYDQEITDKITDLAFGNNSIPIPYREITKSLSESIRMRKLLSNVIDLGILTAWTGLNLEIVEKTLSDHFASKKSVVDLNIQALHVGYDYAKENLLAHFINLKAPAHEFKNNDSLYIDGNSAAALGAVVGGCTFFSWYPITPATSLAESFQQYCHQLRIPNEQGQKFAQVQAEDELSAISMVIGAGWAGCRAMTSTSGPGLSLMAEAAGLSYFAEVPAVIWDVQRAGPSTGLPTRTLQGDIRAAAHLSHGDTTHIVLIPGDPKECFEMAQTAFELAEKFQTLVIVLSDLDVGMNFYATPSFQLEKTKLNRGKVLDSEDLDRLEKFARYQDTDGDGVTYRTLPGTQNAKAAYFTRGTAHNEQSGYSENNVNYKNLLDRLNLKLEKAKPQLPVALMEPKMSPSISNGGAPKTNIILVTCGGTKQIVPELQDLLLEKQVSSQHLRIRALPLDNNLQNHFADSDRIFVLEQNRDGQLREQLVLAYGEHYHKFQSILQYDGLPMSSALAAEQILNRLEL